MTVAYEQVATPEAADNLGFSGSPTILIDSRGPFACGGEPVGRSCHVNQTSGRSAGVLTVEQLRAVVAR